MIKDHRLIQLLDKNWEIDRSITFVKLVDNVREFMTLRTDDEIKKMLVLIDKSINVDDPHTASKFSQDTDFQYINDIKTVLQWALKKIAANVDENEISGEIRDIIKYPEEMESVEVKKHIDFLDSIFNREFKKRKPDSILNIYDAFDWINREISTDNFLSDYLNLDHIKGKISGDVPITIESSKGEVIPIREFSTQEKEKIFDIIDRMMMIQGIIQEIRGKRTLLRDEQRIIHAKYLKKISLEVDMKGKRVYPNKNAIEAEVTSQLSVDNEYHANIAEYRELGNQESNLKIEYNSLSDKKGILIGFIIAHEKYFIH